MKKIVFILSLLLITLCYCCESSDDTMPPEPTPDPPTSDTITPPDKGGISPDAVLSYGVENSKMRSESGFARFATLYAWHIRMNEGWRKDIPGVMDSVSFWESRDTVKNKFRFRGWDVISDSSTLGTLILAHDVLLCATKDTTGNYISPLTIFTEYPNLTYDTIAYIPNQKMRDNLKIVQEYFDNKEFDGVYQMFDTAYNFIPITGAEWLKLKAEGKE